MVLSSQNKSRRRKEMIPFKKIIVRVRETIAIEGSANICKVRQKKRAFLLQGEESQVQEMSFFLY